MDRDIQYIIDEEQKLNRMLEDSRTAARGRIAQHRTRAAAEKASAFEKITSEYNKLTGTKLQEIKSAMDGECDKLRREQEHLLDDAALLEKITGRIVAAILEKR